MVQALNRLDDIKSTFDTYSADLNSGKVEGSRAILAGRTAGLAWENGFHKLAETIWRKEVPAVSGIPSFSEFRAAYDSNPAAFARFAPGAVDPETHRVTYTGPGTAFAFAAGSLAHGVKALVDGPAAYAGGEREWIAYHGAKALEAAGFKVAAVGLNEEVKAGITVEAVKEKGRN